MIQQNASRDGNRLPFDQQDQPIESQALEEVRALATRSFANASPVAIRYFEAAD